MPVENIVRAPNSLELDTSEVRVGDPVRWLTHFAGLESAEPGEQLQTLDRNSRSGCSRCRYTHLSRLLRPETTRYFALAAPRRRVHDHCRGRTNALCRRAEGCWAFALNRATQNSSLCGYLKGFRPQHRSTSNLYCSLQVGSIEGCSEGCVVAESPWIWVAERISGAHGNDDHTWTGRSDPCRRHTVPRAMMSSFSSRHVRNTQVEKVLRRCELGIARQRRAKLTIADE